MTTKYRLIGFSEKGTLEDVKIEELGKNDELRQSSSKETIMV